MVINNMEDARITQDPPMYQTPEYPSVVDTDDVIYELGKQVLDNINKEKLLKVASNKIRMIESSSGTLNNAIDNLKNSNDELTHKLEEKSRELEDLKNSNVIQENDNTGELEALRISNKKYEENNKKLDIELVRIRNELESL